MAVAEGSSSSEVMTDRRLWLAAAVMTAAALMDMLDVTVVNVALPTIRGRLHSGPTALEWVVSGYMLAFAAVLIAAGRLGDVFGRRRLFLIGVGVFGVTSLLAGMSQTVDELIVCRLLQGTAAAILMPQVLATFRTIFTGKDRAAVFGIYGAVAGLAAALGVILGGILTQADLFGLSWRAVFLVNVPIAALVLTAGVRLVPETRSPDQPRFDFMSAIVLAAGLVAIVYPLLEGRQDNWPWWCFLLIVAGIAAIATLAVIEHRHRTNGASLIQIKQFAIPAFSAGVLIQLCFSLALQGFSLTFILWIQAGHHFSPLQAGLTLIPFSVGAILTAPNAGKLALRHGRNILISGALLMAAGTAAAAIPAWLAHEHLTTWAVAPGLLLGGAGLGLLVVPLVNVVLAAVPADTAGGASGVFSTTQQLGGAIGVALIGGAFFAHLRTDQYDYAFKTAIAIAVLAYLVCAALALLLPQDAVTDEDVIHAK